MNPLTRFSVRSVLLRRTHGTVNRERCGGTSGYRSGSSVAATEPTVTFPRHDDRRLPARRRRGFTRRHRAVDGDATATRRRWLWRVLRRTHGARALAARFEPGERIAVWSPTRPESFVLTYATALAGLVLVPVNPTLHATEAAHILSSSGAAGVFLQREYRGADLLAELEHARPGLPALREHVLLDEWDAFLAAGERAGTSDPLPDVAPGDIAQIVYTSGTTGTPKGARLTHRGLTERGAGGGGTVRDPRGRRVRGPASALLCRRPDRRPRDRAAAGYVRDARSLRPRRAPRPVGDRAGHAHGGGPHRAPRAARRSVASRPRPRTRCVR